MRPDKQKQKYKQRAGHGSKPPDKGSSKDTATPVRQDRDGKRAAESVAKEAMPSDESSNSDDEGTKPPTQFRRRVIETNWSRYEELPDEEDEPEGHQVKVDEFQRLLQARIASGAHLTLEDERDWSRPDDVTMAADNDVTDMGYLSIDCDRLAESMKCIPLHTLLGIEELVEQAEMVDYFTELVASKSEPTSECKYDQRTTFTFRSTPKSGAGPEVDDLTDSLARTLNVVPDRRTKSVATSKTEGLGKNLSGSKDENSLKRIEESEMNNTVEGKEEVGDNFVWETEQEVTLDWDNVPEKPVETTETADVPKSPDVPVVEELMPITEEEDELDFLLSLDAPVKKAQPSITGDAKSAAMEAPSTDAGMGKGEDLEQWLDSIL